MFRRRRRWSPTDDVSLDDLANQHHYNRWLHSCFKHHFCNTFSEQSSSKQPIGVLPPTSPQLVMRHFWSIYGGHLVLWFCLLLLQQPHRGLGSLVTRESIHSPTTKNASLSPVNTLLLQSLPPLNARLERKRSTQVCPSICLLLMLCISFWNWCKVWIGWYWKF